MKEGLPPIDTPVGYGHLLGTRWRNKRSGVGYLVTRLAKDRVGGSSNMVYLEPETKGKGGRSTWKYAPHLPFDYVEIKDAQ